jgi:hypothetical protein
LFGKLEDERFNCIKSQKRADEQRLEDRGIVSSMWSSAFGIYAFMISPYFMTRHLTPVARFFDAIILEI